MEIQRRSYNKRARKQIMTVRLDSEVKDRLDRLAAETNRTVSFYITTMIEEQLPDLEQAFLGRYRSEKTLLAQLKADAQKVDTKNEAEVSN